MHTDDDHFHTRFLLMQRAWFGALTLYLIMTLAATAWERIALDQLLAGWVDANGDEWPPPGDAP